jgi:hypothetical protein
MMPEILRIKNQDDFEATMQAAKTDGHTLLNPTHMLVRDNDIMGGWSLGGIPLVTVWNHTQKVSARDTMLMNPVLDSIMKQQTDSYLIACTESSPYNKYMEKLGYTPTWAANLYLK